MFRDEEQREKAIKTLLVFCGVKNECPDFDFIVATEKNVILEMAFKIRSGEGIVAIPSASFLEKDKLRALQDLLSAVGRGPDDVDWWIQRHSHPS